MTAAQQLDDGTTVHRPNPGQLARTAEMFRARQLAAVPDVVELAPAREVRTAPAPADDTPARARARQHWQDCSRGAHAWVDVEVRTGAVTVCLHCPVPAHQAAAVRAAR